jgi:hypothetical protein
MSDKYDKATDALFSMDYILLDRNGIAILPPTSQGGQRVHVNKSGGIPFEALCGSEATNAHFILNMSQVESHPNICPECAAHPDIPLMMLGDV